MSTTKFRITRIHEIQTLEGQSKFDIFEIMKRESEYDISNGTVMELGESGIEFIMLNESINIEIIQ